MYWAHGFCPLRAYSVVEQTDKEQGTKFIQNRASYRLLSVLWEMKQDLREYKFGGEGYLAWCSKKTQAVGALEPTLAGQAVLRWLYLGAEQRPLCLEHVRKEESGSGSWNQG